ncbi:unnamed protein product [Trichobilharzia szidati]|nr:unnamed protein product [Trichobilharzia szidati]
MFCDIIPITIITSVYKLFGQQLINDDQFLSTVATLSSIFNAGGRVAWGGAVDRLSFKIPMSIMHTIWAVVLLSFPHIGGLTGDSLKAVYAIWVFVLYFSLSGVFTIQPAATGVLFGPLNMAVNYGCVFSAFAWSQRSLLKTGKYPHVAELTIAVLLHVLLYVLGTATLMLLK